MYIHTKKINMYVNILWKIINNSNIYIWKYTIESNLKTRRILSQKWISKSTGIKN